MKLQIHFKFISVVVYINEKLILISSLHLVKLVNSFQNSIPNLKVGIHQYLCSSRHIIEKSRLCQENLFNFSNNGNGFSDTWCPKPLDCNKIKVAYLVTMETYTDQFLLSHGFL
jgi:hypothetical protein